MYKCTGFSFFFPHHCYIIPAVLLYELHFLTRIAVTRKNYRACADPQFFRPLLSSFCSLYPALQAVANEPWREAARENRSTLTSKETLYKCTGFSFFFPHHCYIIPAVLLYELHFLTRIAVTRKNYRACADPQFFRPLLSSFCSLYPALQAVANEPWREAARENRSTLTSKETLHFCVRFSFFAFSAGRRGRRPLRCCICIT